MNEPRKQKRVTIYIPEDEYKTLRAKLILAGLTVSEWVRRKMREFLQEQ